MLTDRASSSQRCDRVQNRSATQATAASATSAHPTVSHRPEPVSAGASAGSALGAAAWVFVTATARNGSLRTYCGPIIRPLPTTPNAR